MLERWEAENLHIEPLGGSKKKKNLKVAEGYLLIIRPASWGIVPSVVQGYTNLANNDVD